MSEKLLRFSDKPHPSRARRFRPTLAANRAANAGVEVRPRRIDDRHSCLAVQHQRRRPVCVPFDIGDGRHGNTRPRRDTPSNTRRGRVATAAERASIRRP